MSTFTLPCNLTARARTTLFAALTVCGDDGEIPPEGAPPSVVTTLRRLRGINKREHIIGGLRDLEAEGLATVWRQWRSLHAKIHLGKLRPRDGCQYCGSLARGTGKWCARCKQILGRDDRAWQIRALELHDTGSSPRVIAVILDKPMWVGAIEDGLGRSQAVVPYLLSKGVLGPEWAERLRNATRGASMRGEA